MSRVDRRVESRGPTPARRSALKTPSVRVPAARVTLCRAPRGRRIASETLSASVRSGDEPPPVPCRLTMLLSEAAPRCLRHRARLFFRPRRFAARLLLDLRGVGTLARDARCGTPTRIVADSRRRRNRIRSEDSTEPRLPSTRTLRGRLAVGGSSVHRGGTRGGVRMPVEPSRSKDLR